MQDYIGRVQGLKNDPALLQAAKLVEGKDMDVRYAALYRKAQQLLAVDSKGAKPETQQALTAMQEYENARLGSPEIMAPAVAERTTQFVRTVYEQNKAEIDALLEQRKPTKEAAGAEIVAAWDRAIARLQNGVWTNPTQAYYDVASATAVDPEKALQISKEIYDIVYSKVAQYTEDTLEKAGYNTKAVLATAENAVRTKLLLESSAWFTQLATSSPIQF
jgi:hypothetical protein